MLQSTQGRSNLTVLDKYMHVLALCKFDLHIYSFFFYSFSALFVPFVCAILSVNVNCPSFLLSMPTPSHT